MRNYCPLLGPPLPLDGFQTGINALPSWEGVLRRSSIRTKGPVADLSTTYTPGAGCQERWISPLKPASPLCEL